MSILAFGDEQNFHAAIARAAKKHEQTIEHAETVAVAGDYFDAIKPELLVLCFDSVEKSEIGIKALYAHSELAAFTDFMTLLLCSKNETDIALQLCLDRIFNDYHIAKPLQDSAQLEWRLHSLMSMYRSSPKSAINNIASQLEIVQKTLVQNRHEVSNPASLLNTGNRQKLSNLANQLRESLLPVMASPNTAVTQHPSQQQVTTIIDRALGGISGNIDEIITNIIGTILTQYAALDKDLSTVSKVVNIVSKPVIMVIDDNAGFRETVTQILVDEGYKVITSNLGSKAVGMIIRETPDLVLVDYQMPAMDGLGTIKQVKQLLNGARLPSFIMVTGNSSKDVVTQAKAVGVDGFLVKPLRRTELLEKVKARLGQRNV